MVTLYTTHCPQCAQLEALLKRKGIQYDTVVGFDAITEKGFDSAPILEVDGECYDFSAAKNWILKKK